MTIRSQRRDGLLVDSQGDGSVPRVPGSRREGTEIYLDNGMTMALIAVNFSQVFGSGKPDLYALRQRCRVTYVSPSSTLSNLLNLKEVNG